MKPDKESTVEIDVGTLHFIYKSRHKSKLVFILMRHIVDSYIKKFYVLYIYPQRSQ